MEVKEREEVEEQEIHMTSAAAFVEGGIQDSCDNSCSICLEEFSESDPPTLTNCKHEYHLQCILEWCQRSSQCPMCLQSISMKDPTSQELLEAVERERNIRATATRNTTIFRHPVLGDFELQHLPIGASDAELEERIIQHLAAAAAMRRSHHLGRRESHRNRTSHHGRQHFLVFSTNPNGQSSGNMSSSMAQTSREIEPGSVTIASPPSPMSGLDELQQQSLQLNSVPSDQSSPPARASLTPNLHGMSMNNRNTASQSSPSIQDSAGPSDFQSFSESLKARLNAVSMRYKESISRSTRGWKERFFSRNNSMPDVGSEVQRDNTNMEIPHITRMIERLETGDNEANRVSVSTHSINNPVSGRGNEIINSETHTETTFSESSIPPSCAASSGTT